MFRIKQRQSNHRPHLSAILHTPGWHGMEQLEPRLMLSAERADLLWYEPSTGTVSLWEHDGQQVTDTPYIGSGNINTDDIYAGDFNADGKTDLLFKQIFDNGPGYSMWLCDGQTVTSSGEIAAQTNKHEWKVATIADLNKDGKDDILWLNTNNGQLSVWYMDGLTVSGDDRISYVVDNPDRVTIDSGDFDDDQKPDLVIIEYDPADQNHDNPDIRFVILDGINATGLLGYDHPNTQGHNHYAGAGDFNNDGLTDLAWYNGRPRLKTEPQNTFVWFNSLPAGTTPTPTHEGVGSAKMKVEGTQNITGPTQGWYLFIYNHIGTKPNVPTPTPHPKPGPTPTHNTTPGTDAGPVKPMTDDVKTNNSGADAYVYGDNVLQTGFDSAKSDTWPAVHPGGINDPTLSTDAPLYGLAVTDDFNQPMQSNDFWTALMTKPVGSGTGSIYTEPLTNVLCDSSFNPNVDKDKNAQGVSMSYYSKVMVDTTHTDTVANEQFIDVSSKVFVVGLQDVSPIADADNNVYNTLIRSYSDWGVDFQYTDNGSTMRVEMIQGSPFVWYSRTAGSAAFRAFAAANSVTVWGDGWTDESASTVSGLAIPTTTKITGITLPVNTSIQLTMNGAGGVSGQQMTTTVTATVSTSGSESITIADPITLTGAVITNMATFDTADQIAEHAFGVTLQIPVSVKNFTPYTQEMNFVVIADQGDWTNPTDAAGSVSFENTSATLVATAAMPSSLIGASNTDKFNFAKNVLAPHAFNIPRDTVSGGTVTQHATQVSDATYNAATDLGYNPKTGLLRTQLQVNTINPTDSSKNGDPTLVLLYPHQYTQMPDYADKTRAQLDTLLPYHYDTLNGRAYLYYQTTSGFTVTDDVTTQVRVAPNLPFLPGIAVDTNQDAYNKVLEEVKVWVTDITQGGA